MNNSATQEFQQGLTYLNQGNLTEASRVFEKLLKKDKRNPNLLMAAGLAAAQAGNFKKATQHFRVAVKVDGKNAEAWNNLGNTLKEQGKFKEAQEAFEKALSRKPNFPDAQYNAAFNQIALGNPQVAAETFRSLLTRAPDDTQILNGLGIALSQTGRYDEAIDYLRRSYEMLPQDADVLNNLANAWRCLGSAEQAVKWYKAVEESRGNNSIAGQALAFNVNFLDSISDEEVASYAHLWAKRYASSPTENETTSAKRQQADKPIRLGFFSPDLRRHSVYYFIKPLLIHLDPSQFEIACFSNTDRPDSYTQELKTFAKEWIDTHKLSDDALVRKVKERKIDIAIEMAGHTKGNRLLALAKRPAPIQITWLGYPNTTGLPSIDYRIVDNITDPSGPADQYHSEKLVRLDRCFLAFAPPDMKPPIKESPVDYNGFITFGSFNAIRKIQPKTLKVWAKILERTKNSRLLFKNTATANEDSLKYLLNLCQQSGLNPEKIDFLPFQDTTSAHLEAYNGVDIALDCFPYNGTTTTCEAFSMGVPVVILEGSRHAGRVGVSLARALGESSLVASCEADYIDLAVNLAQSHENLTVKRRERAERLAVSTLCDGKDFAAKFGDTLRRIVRA